MYIFKIYLIKLYNADINNLLKEYGYCYILLAHNNGGGITMISIYKHIAK